jgi:hypothetical protein
MSLWGVGLDESSIYAQRCAMYEYMCEGDVAAHVCRSTHNLTMALGMRMAEHMCRRPLS